MPESVFFRLLKVPIDAKGDALAAAVAALNAGGDPPPAPPVDGGQGGPPLPTTFVVDPAAFAQIPGSPFPYWAGQHIYDIFATRPTLGGGSDVKQGLATADDFRFVRAIWEVPAASIGYAAADTQRGQGWVHFAKGGAYSPYYADVHLVVDWRENGQGLRDFERAFIRNEAHYFRPGLTWPLRTQLGLNLRALPAGCVFGHKGPAIFVRDDDGHMLAALLAVANSLPLKMLVALQMAFGSYEVGVIQRTPVPPQLQSPPANLQSPISSLSSLAHEAHDLQRDRDRGDETTHAFGLPDLARRRAVSLAAAGAALDAEAQARGARLAAIQADIDSQVFALYGLSAADEALVRAEMGAEPTTDHGPRTTDDGPPTTDDRPPTTEDEDEGEAEAAAGGAGEAARRVQDLLMWCVGVAFGRWDARLALDASLLPALQNPFEPLPRVAPGGLVGPDGLPARPGGIVSAAWLRARPTAISLPPPRAVASPTIADGEYPLPIAWDGILVDDPTHAADIVSRVQAVLRLLYGERADAVEGEACDALGVADLRAYLRDPRRCFAFHIKRYSRSRRKAPLYWLLQSERRGYAVWLYYPRLTATSLYAVARPPYADTKVALETARLDELRQGLDGLAGAARRQRERDIERQARLAAEVTAFRDRLDRVARLNLTPDANDGVLLSMAPLRELVPWPEARRAWDSLVAGQYAWSTMSRQMRDHGLVRG